MNGRCWPAVLALLSLLTFASPARAATSLFSDGFESGDYSAWSQVQTGGDGMAVVQSATVRTGGLAAQLSETATSGSKAYARKTFSSAQSDLTASGDFRVVTEGASGGNVPFFRLLSPTGARMVSLYRQNGTSGTIGLTIGSTHASTTGKLALNTWGSVGVHLTPTSIDVTLNGTTIYSGATSAGAPGVSTVQIGNDTAAQAFSIVVDTVNVTSGGTSTPTAPVNTSPPTVSGSPQAGATLTASPGTWTGAAPISFAYQWQRCSSSGSACAALSGATGSTYVVSSADVGATLRLVVTASNPVGSASANSVVTAIVQTASAGPVNTALPTISGTARQGQTLNAGPGGWTGTSPITFKYSWQRCDTTGAACTAAGSGSTYLVVSADVGHTLRVVVTATNSGGSGTATSSPTASITASAIAGSVVASWPMDETSGTVMSDAGGKHPGTLHSVQLGLPGFSGFAYNFTGSSYVSVPSAGDLNPGSSNMTMTIHLKTTGTPPPPPADWDVIRKGLYSTTGGEIKLEFQQSGQASCGFKGSGGYSELIAGPALNNGQWHTIQCAKTSSSIKLTVDGTTFSKSAALGSMANSDAVVIGSRPGSDWYRGALDEASIQIG